MKAKDLRIGQMFRDGLGNQLFRLLEIVPNPRRPKSRLWRVECIESAPGPRGPVMSAFFASPGLVLYLNGNQEVTPL